MTATYGCPTLASSWLGNTHEEDYPVSSPLHIRLLGDFRLSCDGEPVTRVHTTHLQSLLAYLLLPHDAPQQREKDEALAVLYSMKDEVLHV